MNENPYQSPEPPPEGSSREAKHLVPSFASTWDVSLLFAAGGVIAVGFLAFLTGIICYHIAPGYFTRSRFLLEHRWEGALETGMLFLPAGVFLGFCLGWITPWIMSLTVRITRFRARQERKRNSAAK